MAIIGLGGIGATAAEMMARCGIGKLILIDRSPVEAINLNRPPYPKPYLYTDPNP